MARTRKPLPWRHGLDTVGRGLLVTLVILLLSRQAKSGLLEEMGLDGGEGDSGGRGGGHREPLGEFQDQDTLQRLSSGVFFRRQGVLTPHTARVSQSFLLRMPSLEDLTPTPLLQCAHPPNNCSHLHEMLWGRSLKTHQRLEEVFNSFSQRLNSSVTSPDAILLPPLRHEALTSQSQDVGEEWEEGQPYLDTGNSPVEEPGQSPRHRLVTMNFVSVELDKLGVGLTNMGHSLNDLRQYASHWVENAAQVTRHQLLEELQLVLDTYGAAALTSRYTAALGALNKGTVSSDLVPSDLQANLRAEVTALCQGGDVTLSPFAVSAFREGDSLRITMTLEGGRSEDEFQVWGVHPVPLMLDVEKGRGSSRLVDVPPFLAISKDESRFLELTKEQFRDCGGPVGRFCPHKLVPMSSAEGPSSCVWSLHRMEKSDIRSRCHYEASEAALPPALLEYGRGWLLLTNISTLTWVHSDDATDREEVTACPKSQCVAHVPCHYRVVADHFSLPARHVGCTEHRPVARVFFPLNLPVVWRAEMNLAHFLIPPNAIETAHISVTLGDMDKLRQAPTFFMLEEPLRANVSVQVQQWPVANSTRAASPRESSADVALGVLACLVLGLAVFYSVLKERHARLLLAKISDENFDAPMTWGEQPQGQGGGVLLSGVTSF